MGGCTHSVGVLALQVLERGLGVVDLVEDLLGREAQARKPEGRRHQEQQEGDLPVAARAGRRASQESITAQES